MYAIEPHDYLFDQYIIIDDAGQVIYQGLTFRQAVAAWKWLNRRPMTTTTHHDLIWGLGTGALRKHAIVSLLW